MNTRRILLLASIAAGGLFVAAASGAAPLSVSSFGADSATEPAKHTYLADYRDDDEGDRQHERNIKHESDDDQVGQRNDGEDDDDDDDEAGGRWNGPAPVGSATTPDNGLIRKGSTPKVQMN